jgi:hypothetical protein
MGFLWNTRYSQVLGSCNCVCWRWWKNLHLPWKKTTKQSSRRWIMTRVVKLMENWGFRAVNFEDWERYTTHWCSNRTTNWSKREQECLSWDPMDRKTRNKNIWLWDKARLMYTRKVHDFSHECIQEHTHPFQPLSLLTGSNVRGFEGLTLNTSAPIQVYFKRRRWRF